MAGDHVVYTRILEDIKIYYLGRANCLNMIVERGNFSELRHMRMGHRKMCEALAIGCE